MNICATFLGHKLKFSFTFKMKILYFVSATNSDALGMPLTIIEQFLIKLNGLYNAFNVDNRDI